jgi:hypothetical protein
MAKLQAHHYHHKIPPATDCPTIFNLPDAGTCTLNHTSFEGVMPGHPIGFGTEEGVAPTLLNVSDVQIVSTGIKIAAQGSSFTGG